ncbi:hypothetical protein GCM10009834_45800 [Streptomonospora arabica]
MRRPSVPVPPVTSVCVGLLAMAVILLRSRLSGSAAAPDRRATFAAFRASVAPLPRPSTAVFGA